MGRLFRGVFEIAAGSGTLSTDYIRLPARGRLRAVTASAVRNPADPGQCYAEVGIMRGPSAAVSGQVPSEHIMAVFIAEELWDGYSPSWFGNIPLDNDVQLFVMAKASGALSAALPYVRVSYLVES